MRPLAVRTLLLWALALSAPLRAGQVQGPVSGDIQLGNQSGSVGANLGAPAPVQLSVPSLAGTGAPTLASSLTPAPVLIQPVAQAAAVQPLAAKAAAIPVLPNSAAAPVKPQALAEPLKSAPSAPDASPEVGTDPGRALFDQGAARPDEAPAASGGLWGKVKNYLALGEVAPAWPGNAGDAVRIGRYKTALGKPVGEGGTSKVWQSANGQYVLKILHPGAMAIPGVREEAAILRAIDKSDLPVAKLLAESRDGKVLVKEFIEGSTAHEILMGSAFSRSQSQGWPELAAKLIQGGITADLARGNLVWQHWRTRWVIVDAGSLTDGGPKAVLDQMMAPELLANAGVDPVVFLSGLRARLGPDSALWAKTLEALRSSKSAAQPLAALARLDAAPAGPALTFDPAPKGPAALDDTIVSGAEVAKRIGYDPLRAKTQRKLHGDDPGKLNTTILAVEQPGKAPVVVKIAQWDIIRNEVALRRIARRFFGRYFRTPASLAVDREYDSFMVMEKLDASPSYYKDALTLEQRVAAALFIRTFGISDVNPGNVLSPARGGLPWLIDFEQAFGRAAPVAGRIPDERIALEMPWMSRASHNRVEDYQPGVRAWRALFAKPETRAAILSDLAASGFSPAQGAELLARFDLNVADLDWTLQNDADFVNQFSDRKAAQR